MHGLVHDYKRPPNNLSASGSLLQRIILLKLSILNVSSACTYPLRKAHVLLSSLKIIVFINLVTDVRNLSPYHGSTCLIYSPDRGLAGGGRRSGHEATVFVSLSALKHSAETNGGEAGALPPLGSRAKVLLG